MVDDNTTTPASSTPSSSSQRPDTDDSSNTNPPDPGTPFPMNGSSASLMNDVIMPCFLFVVFHILTRNWIIAADDARCASFLNHVTQQAATMAASAGANDSTDAAASVRVDLNGNEEEDAEPVDSQIPTGPSTDASAAANESMGQNPPSGEPLSDILDDSQIPNATVEDTTSQNPSSGEPLSDAVDAVSVDANVNGEEHAGQHRAPFFEIAVDLLIEAVDSQVPNAAVGDIASSVTSQNPPSVEPLLDIVQNPPSEEATSDVVDGVHFDANAKEEHATEHCASCSEITTALFIEAVDSQIPTAATLHASSAANEFTGPNRPSREPLSDTVDDSPNATAGDTPSQNPPALHYIPRRLSSGESVSDVVDAVPIDANVHAEEHAKTANPQIPAAVEGNAVASGSSATSQNPPLSAIAQNPPSEESASDVVEAVPIDANVNEEDQAETANPQIPTMDASAEANDTGEDPPSGAPLSDIVDHSQIPDVTTRNIVNAVSLRANMNKEEHTQSVDSQTPKAAAAGDTTSSDSSTTSQNLLSPVDVNVNEEHAETTDSQIPTAVLEDATTLIVIPEMESERWGDFSIHESSFTPVSAPTLETSARSVLSAVLESLRERDFTPVPLTLTAVRDADGWFMDNTGRYIHRSSFRNTLPPSLYNPAPIISVETPASTIPPTPSTAPRSLPEFTGASRDGTPSSPGPGLAAGTNASSSSSPPADTDTAPPTPPIPPVAPSSKEVDYRGMMKEMKSIRRLVIVLMMMMILQFMWLSYSMASPKCLYLT